MNLDRLRSNDHGEPRGSRKSALMDEVLAIVASTRLDDLFELADLDGSVQIRTLFYYPDGELLDLYLDADAEGFIVTESGEALAWVAGRNPAFDVSPRQDDAIDALCLTHGVERDEGAFSRRMASLDELPETVMRVAQVAMGVSDMHLWMMAERSRRNEPISQTVGN